MHNLIIDTPLGEINFFVFGVTPGVKVRLDAVPLSPRLPAGMSIDSCLGILLQLNCREPAEDLIFEFRLRDRKYDSHSYDGGQHLYAMSWENEQTQLMIGTEDEECLNARLPQEQKYEYCPLGHDEKGISLTLPDLKKGSQCSFQFIVAWQDFPAAEEGACWHAVDVRHADLLKEKGSPG
ncbi:hypothetical protein Pan153_48580 [Gimesia panareensis]|uniref:Uncharacterized protein n=1 Tax=Gimesia panareensis TaxID=2527978 RepID=A0A518FV14_9PLAN|nr:hypothetical protein [Gimesia panareensis]QDV20186.1 hypothetical protein Pan153_48580 [Gimesia panareensis]